MIDIDDELITILPVNIILKCKIISDILEVICYRHFLFIFTYVQCAGSTHAAEQLDLSLLHCQFVLYYLDFEL